MSQSDIRTSETTDQDRAEFYAHLKGVEIECPFEGDPRHDPTHRGHYKALTFDGEYMPPVTTGDGLLEWVELLHSGQQKTAREAIIAAIDAATAAWKKECSNARDRRRRADARRVAQTR